LAFITFRCFEFSHLTEQALYHTNRCRETIDTWRNQGSFRFSAWLRMDCGEEGVTTYRQVSKYRLDLGRMMPSLFTKEWSVARFTCSSWKPVATTLLRHHRF